MVDVNDFAEIECISSSLVKWTFNDIFPPHFAKGQVNRLKIKNVQLDFGGIYECVGTNDMQEMFWAKSLLFVIGMRRANIYI